MYSIACSGRNPQNGDPSTAPFFFRGHSRVHASAMRTTSSCWAINCDGMKSGDTCPGRGGCCLIATLDLSTASAHTRGPQYSNVDSTNILQKICRQCSGHAVVIERLCMTRIIDAIARHALVAPIAARSAPCIDIGTPR